MCTSPSSRQATTSGALKRYFQSRMGCGILFVHIVRIARAFSGNENRSGLITSEREVGRISRFCIERALREHARMSVVGLGRFGDGLVSSHIPKLPHHSHAAISKITCVIPTL